MKSKNIAIIPARGGSKRIPQKNIKDFLGLPLIAYSIKTAIESKLFSKVIVSTNNEKIASIAKKYGAVVPFIRPKELSDDFIGTTDVINHTLEYLKSIGEEYMYCCTIYATAPMLQKEYLQKGFEVLKNSDAINSFSATSMPFPIQRTFKVNQDNRCEMFNPEHFNTRSQDLEEAFQDAGQFYWTKLDKKSNNIFFSNDSIPIILPRHLVQDIDTLEDWTRAEFMYKALYQDKYDRWNNLKKDISTKEPIQFKQGEIYFMSIGINIGYEIYGHNKLFLRPVLIYRKLSSTAFIGIPLTSKQKEGNYYFTFNYTKKTLSTACLNQIRTFDIRRTVYYDGYINTKDFTILKDQIKKFMDITPNHNRKGSGHVSKKRLPKSPSMEIDIIIPKQNNDVK